MGEKKICVYTCITGSYDDLQPVEKEEGIDYICFTNNQRLKSDFWTIIYIEDDFNLGNTLLSRKIKILGHPVINEKYDVSIWVDGAIQVRGSIKCFLEEYCCLDKVNMACFRHRMRNCAYDEAVACIIHRKADKESLIKCLEFLEKEQFPRHYGLAECTVLIRKHNSLDVKHTMELWFELLCRFVRRDQLTFPYCIYKTNLKVHWLELNVFDNPWFFWKAHKQLNETNVSRIFFGDYQNIYSDKYIDQEMVAQGSNRCLKFVIPVDCDQISINLGKHFGKTIKDFRINLQEFAVSFFPGISIKNYTIFDYDDLVIYIKFQFRKGQEIICDFKLLELKETEIQIVVESIIDKYYYDKFIRDNMINDLNKKINTLDKNMEDYNNLKMSPLFWKLKPLCEHQDLKTKIIRKLILNFIN